MVSKLTIDEGRCVHRLSAMARCRACVLVCPRSAWTMDAQGLGFDESLCDGCGLCVAECPTGALTAPLSMPALSSPRDGVRSVTLHCERAPGASLQGGFIPCIHALDEAQLLRWHAQGVGRLSIVTGGCESCTRRPSAELGKRIDRVNEALRARGQRVMHLEHQRDRHAATATAPDIDTQTSPAAGTSTPPASKGSVKPAESPPNRGRRGLLGLLGRSSPADLPDKPAAPRTLMTRSEATRLLARWGPGPVLWAVAFDAKRCDACGACAQLCPTQAIEMTPAGTMVAGVLAFQMSSCVGCGVCVDACAPGALAPAAPLSTIGERRAWSLVSQPCPQCGKAHRVLQAARAAPSAVSCPACRSLAARRSDRIVQATSDTPYKAG